MLSFSLIPSKITYPDFYEQCHTMDRAQKEEFLKHKMEHRPDRQVLIQQHILEDTVTTVSPTIHIKQRQLKKARLTDDLNDRLSHRPGPLELVKGNILLADGKLAQAVKEGQIQFKATSEGKPIKHPVKESGPILTKNRKKSKSKSQPKTKTIKFHEYKGPPSAQKNQSSSNSNTETSYELLLKQQQLFLQLQLEWQNKQHYAQIILPSSQKANLDQSSTANTAANYIVDGNGSGNNNNKNKDSTVNTNDIISSNMPSKSASANANTNNMTSNSSNSTVISNLNTGNIIVNSGSNTFVSGNVASKQTNSITPMMITTSAHPISNVELNSNQNLISAQSVNSSGVNSLNIGSNNANNCVNNLGGIAKIIMKLEDMKVSDLKSELKKRNLPVSGSKPQLIERLKPYVESPIPNNGLNDNSFIDDPMSLSNNNNNNINNDNNDNYFNNNNSLNNAIMIDSSDKAKISMENSQLSIPIKSEPVVYFSIHDGNLNDHQMKRMLDFRKSSVHHHQQQQQQHQQQLIPQSQLSQQQPNSQTSFQLQFQNQSVFASPSVTIPLSALANSQLQIVTTSPAPLSEASSNSKLFQKQFLSTNQTEVNTLLPNQSANLAAIISPSNASASVKASLAVFLQQQKTHQHHLQIQQQKQQQHQQQQHQQQQQQQQQQPQSQPQSQPQPQQQQQQQQPQSQPQSQPQPQQQQQQQQPQSQPQSQPQQQQQQQQQPQSQPQSQQDITGTIDSLFNDLLDFQSSPVNVDYASWFAEMMTDNCPSKSLINSSSSHTTNVPNKQSSSMDHDPVLANNFAETCHYDPLIDLYFGTENECRETNDLTGLGIWDKIDFAA